ncbi:hypothetical protein KJ953_03530 [Patescibacteria group bacterium]|nr:hypothetical protein [Patescibacteria group bacterium]
MKVKQPKSLVEKYLINYCLSSNQARPTASLPGTQTVWLEMQLTQEQ